MTVTLTGSVSSSPAASAVLDGRVLSSVRAISNANAATHPMPMLNHKVLRRNFDVRLGSMCAILANEHIAFAAHGEQSLWHLW
jgi:hypothetical protein